MTTTKKPKRRPASLADAVQRRYDADDKASQEPSADDQLKDLVGQLNRAAGVR